MEVGGLDEGSVVEALLYEQAAKRMATTRARRERKGGREVTSGGVMVSKAGRGTYGKG